MDIYQISIVIICILFLNLLGTVRAQEPTKKCPDDHLPDGYCSDIEECENGKLCYRDVPVLSQETKKMEFGCCNSRCTLSNMPYGMEYEDDSQSTVSYCSNLDKSLFYLDKKHKNNKNLADKEYGCCPRPISDFVYGKVSGVLVDETFSHPKGWTLDEATGEVSGIKSCCTINDCDLDSYCGVVRNPGTMKLVTKKAQNCTTTRKFEKIDNFLRFCYMFPELNLTSIGISKRDQDSNLENLQLCKFQEDCWSLNYYCKLFENQEIGVCRPVLGTVIRFAGARDAFLVHEGGGCSSDEQCNEMGHKWFSYQCQETKDWSEKICVGYEILCSPSALHQHGLHYGCETDQDCVKNFQNDSIHIPKCVRDPFMDRRESACCYEMHSCQWHLDTLPIGISPIGKQMCSNDNDCQELAYHMMQDKIAGKRKIFWGRCQEELENHLGKCCIADVSTLCEIGRPLLPPRQCTNHTDCGTYSNPWCGDEGYCCEDHPGEQSSMCPDGKSIRLLQPECEPSETWCEGQAGYCIMGRCCPMVKPSPNYLIHVWAESPWYYNLSCNDTIDLPENMDMVYCDPMRNVVTRTTRGDKWWYPIRASVGIYCESNDDCASISDSLVCVKEQQGLQRCHTYYDRDPNLYMFILPVSVLGITVLMIFKYWRHDMREVAEGQWEVLR